MYQYKARLQSNHEVIAEGHTVEEIEAAIVSYRRAQKHGEHTRGNEPIEVIDVRRKQLTGERDEKVLKIL